MTDLSTEPSKYKCTCETYKEWRKCIICDKRYCRKCSEYHSHIYCSKPCILKKYPVFHRVSNECLKSTLTKLNL